MSEWMDFIKIGIQILQKLVHYSIRNTGWFILTTNIKEIWFILFDEYGSLITCQNFYSDWRILSRDKILFPLLKRFICNLFSMLKWIRFSWNLCSPFVIETHCCWQCFMNKVGKFYPCLLSRTTTHFDHQLFSMWHLCKKCSY